MMARVKKVPVSETKFQYIFICPGCNQEHAFTDSWNWNNDYDKPTLSPSFLIHGYKFDDNKNSVPFRCHSFIKNGRIQFLNDCTHGLVGKEVDLPDVY